MKPQSSSSTKLAGIKIRIYSQETKTAVCNIHHTNIIIIIISDTNARPSWNVLKPTLGKWGMKWQTKQQRKASGSKSHAVFRRNV